MNYNRTISAFLGVSMFAFGFLKFFDPFQSWYSVQITGSGLGDIAYALGIMGELGVGMLLLSTLALRHKLPSRMQITLAASSSVLVILIMAVGTYVHLHPDVPAAVLPLNIKPPYIPLLFMALAVIQIISLRRPSWRLEQKGQLKDAIRRK